MSELSEQLDLEHLREVAQKAQKATGAWRLRRRTDVRGWGLSEAERRTLTGVIQRTLRDGETGLDDGACNRAGWHISENLVPTVERILAARVASAAAENAALKARLDEVRALAEEMCAFDIVDMPVPDSVDIPEDYELGVNDYGGRLGAVLAAAHDEGSEQR